MTAHCEEQGSHERDDAHRCDTADRRDEHEDRREHGRLMRERPCLHGTIEARCLVREDILSHLAQPNQRHDREHDDDCPVPDERLHRRSRRLRLIARSSSGWVWRAMSISIVTRQPDARMTRARSL